MAHELMNMTLDEAIPLTRALGHYLSLTGIAELHHRCAGCACSQCTGWRAATSHAGQFEGGAPCSCGTAAAPCWHARTCSASMQAAS